MTTFFNRTVFKTGIAWLFATAFLVLLILQVGGWLHLREFLYRRTDAPQRAYAAKSQFLAAEDRSQPLHMMLEGKFPGPLKDTTVERWRDPVDDTVCYIYMPIAVAHASGPDGLVQYGSANIGSISCFPERSPRS